MAGVIVGVEISLLVKVVVDVDVDDSVMSLCDWWCAIMSLARKTLGIDPGCDGGTDVLGRKVEDPGIGREIWRGTIRDARTVLGSIAGAVI